MSDITGVGSSAAGADAPSEQRRLRDAVGQLEGLFVQQLFQAMRETVPKDGLTDGGAGEQMFTSMLDEKLSAMVPASWDHDGLSDAIMRQLKPLAGGSSGTTETAPSPKNRP